MHDVLLRFLLSIAIYLYLTFSYSIKACLKVCAYVSKQVERVRRSMDGKNVDTVLTELGVRFHRLIHEHLQQFSYSSMGGMLAICDVAEYRRCAKDFRVSRGQRSHRVYFGHFKFCDFV